MSGKLITTLKALFPFIAALGVYFWVNSIDQQKQIHQNHSGEVDIQAIPIEGFKADQ